MSGRAPDLVVVGAGAAGLGAARTALDLGLEVLILEAKDRLGGRAHTDTTSLGVTWDRGAHWLHSADINPWTELADRLGVAYQRSTTAWRLWSGNWANAEQRMAVLAYYQEMFAAIARAGAAAEATGQDRAAADVVAAQPGFRPALQPLFDSWFAALVGVEPARASVLDYARWRDTEQNWPVVDGFGALVGRYGTGLPVRLRTAVETICWDGPGVTVGSTAGDLKARAVIVTTSTNRLAAGGIRFQPPLPLATQEALNLLPLGEAAKVAVAFARDVFGREVPCDVHLERPTLETIQFELAPFGRPLAIGHLGGRFAAEMEQAGPEAGAAFAIERLVEMFGSDLRRHVSGVETTAWGLDPHVGGGYSCPRPGSADQRSVLATPLAGRLFLAGEACSRDAYGTVHGALQSGIAAAQAVAEALTPTLGRSAGAGP